ncbi:interleukin-31 receptor subunit alpha isoform 2 precursor [Homo sapiens]|uniref:Isoform 12 of Interleukin-31 receptor subunit alpha n=2 Tax=Homo sapiens TaxID=9606 RepID=Q8NI17-12|nr:interleukin-31 receptor subunit alpha isoform 2 precursor [Homo sapiens]|eukprot:NP_001229565.1 interleukin-31 receptor subunit alpha isoform 2 precursor [Homo sapiens]
MKLSPQPSCVNLGMMWTWALWMLPSLCKFSLAALPAKPENISCVYYYRKNLTCTWSPGKETSYTQYTVKRTYAFGEKHDNCTTNSSTSENRASCSFFLPRITIPDNYTIEVEAENGDGVIKSHMTYWRLENIAKTEPPKIFRVKPVLGIKRMIQIEWIKPELAPVSSDLKYTLRFRTVNSTSWMEVNFAKNRKDKNQTYNLTGLQPFTEYVIALRCAVKESKFWSDWSQEKMGMTEEEAPCGLELWRVLKPAEADGRRPVRLLWKKARGAPVLEKTLGYNIWYYPESNTNLTETMNTTNQQLELHLGGESFWVSMISYNSLGKSPVATLRIPAIQEKSFQCIEVMQACVAEDQLVVKWQSSALDVNTWMIEWFPDVDSEPTTLSWESVSQATNWTIQQDKLKPFWCYNISVYPMLHDKVGEPYSIQAYAKEGVPSEGPETKVENIGVKTVTITWKEIPKSERKGIICNYTIFYQAEGGKGFSKTVNSSILQYGLESLKRKTSYIVQVMASTSAGGTNGTSINFKTLSFSVFEIILITSLIGGGLLILIILTVAYGLKKPNKLTHLCWPTVPNPAESSIATWHGDDFKDKLNLKESDDSVNTEDRILKPCSTPSDKLVIDKLVVNFGNVLQEIFTDEARTGQENNLGGEKNGYVTCPFRPDCPLGKSFEELPVSPEIPPRKSQYLRSRMPEGTRPEAKEQLLFSGQSLVPDHLCEEGAPNPYLKNSVTAREFLVSEKLPEHTKGEV